MLMKSCKECRKDKRNFCKKHMAMSVIVALTIIHVVCAVSCCRGGDNDKQK